jgi:hypothetical protein
MIKLSRKDSGCAKIGGICALVSHLPGDETSEFMPKHDFSLSS